MGASRALDDSEQLSSKRAKASRLLVLVLVLGAGAAACDVPGVSQVPDAPLIEAASGTVPADLRQEDWVKEFWPEGPPPLVARLRLGNGSFLFLTDWRPPPRCRLLYVAQEDGSDRRYSRTTCGLLPTGDRAADRVLDLYNYMPTDGVSPRITTGTLDSSVDELRITFTECGSHTYALDGPTVPSKPTRRVFMLDMVATAVWGTVVADQPIGLTVGVIRAACSAGD